ncbi:hypothetical protein BGX31_006419 [Mortierella sp. GBA43]|nr:hypothetical protein BGX31_006419 [Mortierella sp. GBA43]
MVFGSAFSSPLGSLSSKQALELANVYLENARSAVDLDIALVLCHDTEVSLSQAKKHPDNQTIIEGIATAYGDLGSQLEIRGNDSGAQAMYKKAGKLGFKHRRTVAVIPAHIFTKNVPPSAFEFKLPEPDERLNSTRQLANCLSLLKASPSETLLPAAHKWLQVIRKDADEQDRLRSISIEIIRAFKRDRIKDSKVVGEVVCLAPALNKDSFRDLLKEFYSGIDHSGLLDIHQLDGLAQMMQGADHGYLGADDLVKILDLLSARLKDTHHQSADHRHGLTLAISHVLDAMADTNVKDLDRKKLHEPLSSYLSGLMKSSDPYLVYQAAYASQALLCVPDNETPWQAALRRTGKVVQGVSGLVSAVKGVDLNKFLNGLDDIQKGLEGASKVVDIVATAYKNAAALSKSGQSFFKSLKEGLSFDRKRDWYAALRGADIMIRDGEFASFRRLICEAPCRLDPAFQWGVCQRLCEIAINPIWDVDTRQGAVSLMGEIYRNDEIWGQHVSVKQWILNILMQLSIPSEDGLQLHTAIAETMLQGLEADGDTKKQDMCRVCRENGPISYPLKTTESKLASPSLLDRAQNRPDVEGSLRFLRKQRTGDRDNIVYIPPQAKNGLQASDDDQFPLMEKVNEFLESERKVFLLLGESGAGKSTFNHQLEFNLWNSYKTRTGRIPLYINLPAIDKPEHDLIAKQLRKSEFTEPQIRELKHHRRFILICDGYDESQQTRNLYVSNNLNQKGEWDVQMLISCRSEYLGIDYRDRFQPGDRNQQSSPLLLQEAVITSFSRDQVQAYIEQYVTLRQPLWQTEDYEQALELIPSLYDLVKNPFLMSLSLEVLPRMIDPGKQLSDARVTRVALYDHFMEQWFERSKKRLGEIDLSPQSRVVYESLSNEGFTQNGIDFLKALSVAIYKNQGGNPVVQYSRAKDEGSWKTEFFSRDEEKQILREACPLSRNANQYRFIHRSILEYGLSIAVFDPHDQQQTHPPESALGRRGSVQSAMSFEILDTTEKEATVLALEPDISSPLMWKSFVNDNSLLQFLQERAQHEQVFKKQLLSYIEHSKKDKKWRTAAANAITILVQAGYQFIGTDLEGIQIPGSDLSYGVFDSVQLQEADLRKANLRGVWMRGSDLGGALMSGAQFGEHPLITQDYGARSCTYSPDGQSFAMGLYNGDIAVYSTSTWDILQTLRGHYDTIRSVVYSPMGDHIASCSRDYTLRLWDTETGECRFILIGHTGPVHGIAYSPQGDTIASASGDGTVRLWDVATGECRRTLLGHERKVLSVVYSPDEINIASGGTDATVRIWNAESGHCDLILSGHKDAIWAVAFSHQGEQLASASADKTSQDPVDIL